MLLLVTGASSNHHCPLMNLVASVRALHDPRIRLVVYDLGLAAHEVAAVSAASFEPVRRFDFARYPPFFALSECSYAWKPAVIAEAAKDAASEMLLVWLDAGCLVQPGFVDAWTKALATCCVVSPRSSGTIGDWAHPGCVRALGIGPDILKCPNRSGGVVGFSLSAPAARKLLARWLRWAHDRVKITPHGSSRANHRQDQTLLSILIAQQQSLKIFDLADLKTVVHRDC